MTILEKYFKKKLLISIEGHADETTINELIDDITSAANNITNNANIINSHVQVFEVIQQDSTTYEKFD